MQKKAMAALDALVTPLIKKGQPLTHIYARRHSNAGLLIADGADGTVASLLGHKGLVSITRIFGI